MEQRQPPLEGWNSVELRAETQGAAGTCAPTPRTGNSAASRQLCRTDRGYRSTRQGRSRLAPIGFEDRVADSEDHAGRDEQAHPNIPGRSLPFGHVPHVRDNAAPRQNDPAAREGPNRSATNCFGSGKIPTLRPFVRNCLGGSYCCETSNPAAARAKAKLALEWSLPVSGRFSTVGRFGTHP